MTLVMEASLRIGTKAGILLVLLMPFIFTSPSLFPFIVGKALYAHAVIEVTFALWLLLIWVAPRYRPPRSWILLALLAYFLVATLATLTSVSITRSLWSTFSRMDGLVYLAHWMAFVLVLASVLRTLAEWRLVLNASLVAAVVAAILGLAQYYGFTFPPLLSGEVGRVQGTLGNPTFMGAYLVMSFFLALALLGDSFSLPAPIPQDPRRRRRRQRQRQPTPPDPTLLWAKRSAWALAAGISLWGLVLTGSRGAFIGLLVGLAAAGIAYVAWGQRTRVKPFIRIALVTIIALVIAGVVLRNTPMMDRLASTNVLIERLQLGISDPSAQSHWISAATGFRAGLRRPFLGWGPENYTVAFDLYAPSTYFDVANTYLDKAHNKLVEEFSTKGFLGLATYLLVWALMLIVLVRTLRTRPREEFLFLGIGAALVAYFAQNLFLFDTLVPFMQLMLLVGFVASVEAHLLPGGSLSRPPPLADLAARAEARLSTTPFRRAADWLRRVGGSIARLRADPSRFEMATVLLVVALFAATGLLVYATSFRIYRSATLVVPPLVTPDIKALPWAARADMVEEAIDTFPNLANKPRMYFADTVSGNWKTMNRDEAQMLLRVAEEEIKKGLRQEPLNLRLYLALAQLYQEARTLDPAYLDRAQEALDVAKKLGPHRTQVLGLLERQERLVAERET